MANMGHCRFQNTLKDLQDCYEHLEDDDLSVEEVKAQKKLIELAHWFSLDGTCILGDD